MFIQILQLVFLECHEFAFYFKEDENQNLKMIEVFCYLNLSFYDCNFRNGHSLAISVGCLLETWDIFNNMWRAHSFGDFKYNWDYLCIASFL
jgi:hypothetical protein